MADLSDVRNTITGLIENAVYPFGTSQPSIAGVDIRVFGGWPFPASLDNDLLAGKINISIFPTNIVRPTTRFDIQWQQLSVNPATIILTANDTTVTVSGTISVPQTCMIIINGTGYPYVVQQSDTLDSIAAGIAALIPGASALGAVVTIPNAYSLIARVTTQGSAVREFIREERVFKITVWSPTDSLRALIGNAINVALGKIQRIELPDGYYARIKFAGQMDTDVVEKARLYRRDIDFSVEYAITEAQESTVITDTTDTTIYTPNSL